MFANRIVTGPALQHLSIRPLSEPTSVVLALLLAVNIAYAEVVTFGSGDSSFEVEFVEIGDAGNPSDLTLVRYSTASQSHHRPSGTFVKVGVVDYPYEISKHEISYEQFQGAIDGGLVIDDRFYHSRFRQRVIDFGVFEDTPVIVDSTNAMAFVNWMNESEGFPAAYKLPEDLTQLHLVALHWQIGEPGFNPENPIRNSLAKYALPDAHEWHKAAYYDPERNRYSEFSTGSDQLPSPVPFGDAVGTAVHSQPWPTGPAPVIHAGGLSHYGVMGLDGNVPEWEEGSYSVDEYDSVGFTILTTRGGGWNEGLSDRQEMHGRLSAVEGSSGQTGVRIVAVPPSDVSVGDFDFDGTVTSADADALATAIEIDAGFSTGISPADGRRFRNYDFVLENRKFDLNTDSFINDADRQLWLTHVAKTSSGDSDLDGDVDFEDFLALANNFGESPSSWSRGDFDGNNETNFVDFLTVATNFGNASVNDVGLAIATPSVPEPSSITLSLIFLSLSTLRKPSRRRVGTGTASEWKAFLMFSCSPAEPMPHVSTEWNFLSRNGSGISATYVAPLSGT